MPILFKLKCGDEVRRSTFSELPPWDALSSRLSALYGIAPDRLGVSYTDPDGDEITLNTQEELLDYYETYHKGQPGQSLRLKVVDLVSLRGASTMTPKVVPFAFETDDDWQRLPTMQGLSDIDAFHRSSDLDGPHAFVEVDESVDDGSHTPHGGAAADHHSPASTVRPSLGKGKERELLSFPSTASLIDEEVGDKHPIHVKDCSGQTSGAVLDMETMEQDSKEEDHVDAPRQPHSAPTATDDDNDPPLPTIDDPPIPSLTEDIATLLTSLNSAVAMNPDLSRNLRRIVENATSGRYWRAHRDSLHQAVNNMTESMGVAREELRRNAEAEAATRISNTLGTIFQSLAVAPPEGGSSTREGVDPTDPRGQVLPDSPNLPGAFPNAQGHSRHHHRRRSRGYSGNLTMPQNSTNATQSSPTPNDDDSHASAPPKGPPRFSGPPATPDIEPQSSTADRMWDPETRPPWLPAPPAIPTQFSQVRQSAQELRAAVEAAKEQYKAEKQRYRREREERRKQKEEHRRAANATPGAAYSSLPVSREPSQEHGHSSPLARSNSHIVSLARGPYPQMEIVSVPRRSATLGAKREEQDISRIIAKITRRLGDMGFTETSHPNLPNQITARISENQDKQFTKDMEDNVFTDLLEGLLATSPQATTPKTPIASGSGARDNLDSVPGGWH